MHLLFIAGHTLLALSQSKSQNIYVKKTELYTSHCFRPTEGTMILDAGEDILALKHTREQKSAK